ncbi:flagellar hook capping protein [Catenovulum sp. SM1970]|uniref:flagellar hook assembly protein FlgD n=1 Tax=Marinifaba aquimaris TaxID=2741323 RepID=UPI001572A806|nr:flagellar hook capping FlgD N-terminal domain-containing protein [Marinifaba aquimaris]NTS77380.1 flagellar hook capping protein [Marinifaba aquimaris]
MTVEAIGNQISTNAVEASNSSISQEDFVELFLAQLNFQDPLEPLNNREFLAQLAQFSTLEQGRLTNENLTGLLSMTSSGQSLSLLGKNVQVQTASGVSFEGRVESADYSSTGPLLSIRNTQGELTENISLSQIQIIED